MGIKFRTLRCMSLNHGSSKVLLRENLDGKPILGMISKKIEEICKKQKITSSHFPYVSQFDKLLLENLQTHSYVKRQPSTSFYLDVQWTSFQDYLRSLKPHAAKNARREIKKCIENKITIEELQEENPAKLAELYANLSSKYKCKENICDINFFTQLDEHAKAITKLFVAKKNSEIVGFSLTLRYKEILDVFMLGFNYDVLTKTDFTYFNLCYYTPIQWAIDHGVRKINFHGTAEQAKLARGCKPEKLYYFIKYHNKPLRIITTKVLNPLKDRIV